MLKKLQKIDWKNLRTAQGKNADFIPNLLLGLLSYKQEEVESASSKLYNNIARQGGIYEASYYVIPFLNTIIQQNIKESKLSAYDLLFEIVNGYPVYDEKIIHNGEELELREANYRCAFDSINQYLDDLEYTDNKETMNYIIDLISLFYKEKELFMKRLNEIKESSIFKKKIEELIDDINISQEERDEIKQKIDLEYQKEYGQTIAKLNEREVPTRGVTEEELKKISHNANKILTYKIKKGEGLGDIYFEMQEKDFIKKYVSYKLIDDGIVSVQYLSKDTLRIYNFFDSVRVTVDVHKGVTSIILQNNFQGKYKNIIGINSTYSEIKNALIKINEYGGYYEDYLLVRDKNNFLIAFDFKSVDPEETEILEDWMEWEKDKGEEIIKDCKVDYIVINSQK